MQLNCIIQLKNILFLNDYDIDENHDIQPKSDNKKLGKKWVKEIVIFCQLEFSTKIKVPQLGSARSPHISARFEPENSSSGSSLTKRL